ncbi:MAG: phosphoglycerate mutase (2,3-diphosphoglycerate-independent), partial [Zetaproteobacteria bacterium]
RLSEAPVVLVVLDGWGIGTGGPEDAIAAAHTPVFDRLWREHPHTTLLTHGPYVGLPNPKDLGGSEVGHLTMGAGRILDQGPTRINKAIADGSFFRTEAMREVIEAGKRGTLHLIGLLSDGGIHAHIDHFLAMIDHAMEQGVRRLRVHALLDGRDVGVQTAHKYVARLEQAFMLARERGLDYRFASGGGRERIVMDRDKNWDRVREGWEIIVHGRGRYRFRSMLEAIEHFRREHPGIVDQDIPGFVIVDEHDRPVGPVRDGDAVVMMNFRGDRAIEITEAFELDEFPHFDRGRRPRVVYAGMMVYDEDRNLPHRQLMPPTRVDNPFGDRVLAMGKKQFRVAETQKYPHVTFFFNGGRREPKDPALERYELIPSDKGVWFADKPEMKAREVGEATAAFIRAREYAFGLVNFANADMVGH